MKTLLKTIGIVSTPIGSSFYFKTVPKREYSGRYYPPYRLGKLKDRN